MDTLYENRYNFNFFFRHHNRIGAPSDKYHFHDDYEVFISCVDSGYFYVNGEKTPLHYGDIYFFSNTDMHKVHIGKNVRYERYIIMFDRSFVEEFSTAKTNLLNIFEQQTPVKKLCSTEYPFKQVFPDLIQRLEELEKRYQDVYQYGNDVALQLCFADLLLYLTQLYIRAHPESVPQNTQSTYASTNSAKVREIIQYIHMYYQEPLSLDLLAETFFLSKTSLNSLFQQYVGISTKKYIINIRLSHAKYLLTHGTSVQDTCSLCGFNDYSHFIRTFTNVVGTSPKQYALRYSQDNGHHLI